jgi:hypothetical protein
MSANRLTQYLTEISEPTQAAPPASPSAFVLTPSSPFSSTTSLTAAMYQWAFEHAKAHLASDALPNLFSCMN